VRGTSVRRESGWRRRASEELTPPAFASLYTVSPAELVIDAVRQSCRRDGLVYRDAATVSRIGVSDVARDG
jgi:hypothetical protein